MQTSHKMLAAFMVLVLGAAVPTWLFYDRPEKIVAEALRKLDGDASFFAAATVATIAPPAAIRAAGGDPSALVPIVFVGEGGMNAPGVLPPSGRANFVMVGQGKDGTDLSFDAVFPGDGNAFARLSNLPVVPETAQVLSAVDGTWYSMTSREFMGLLLGAGEGEAEGAVTGTRPSVTLQALRKKITDGSLFASPRQLGMNSLGRAAVRRYSLPLREEALLPFVQDAVSMLRGRSLSGAELSALSAALRERDVRLEVWVSAKTRELVQVQLDVASKTGTVSIDEDRNRLGIIIKFTAWGEPVDTPVPERSTPFTDILSRFKQSGS